MGVGPPIHQFRGGRSPDAGMDVGPPPREDATAEAGLGARTMGYRVQRPVRHLVLLAAVVLAGCGSSAGTTTTLTAGEPPSTLGPATTSPQSTTTTSVPEPLPGGDGAEGSGCSPGADVLPDGLWFGYPVELDDGTIAFDLACWYTGQAAVDAAEEDGAESPPNDYYVRNENDTLRAVPVAPSASVTWYPNFGDPSSETVVDYAEWVGSFEERGLTPGVWLTVEDGLAVEIREQWVP